MAKLKRSLGLWELTFIGVGIIIGAGIYVLIGQAAGLAGNAVWLSFLLAALVSVFTGLSYAELSSLFPKAGAEYAYMKKTFDRRLSWMVGWLIVLNGFIGAATVAIGFSNYFSALFDTPIILTALTMIIANTIILFFGVKESARIAILCTLIETAGLILIIAIGIPFLGSVDYMEAASGLEGIISAGTLIFFAFMGFETITRLSEETNNPQKNVPKAIIFSIAITTVIYILVAVSAISILGWETLSQSDSPMATIASSVFGSNAFLALSLIALFSTANTVMVLMLTTSRLIYGIADFGTIPKIFRSISRKNSVPWVAVLGTAVPTMAFVLLGDIKTVANLSNFTIFVTFIMVNACVIRLRMKGYKCKGCFRVPYSIGKIPILPVFGILTCLFMLLGVGWEVFWYGVALTTIGMIIFEFTEFRIDHGHFSRNRVRHKSLVKCVKK